MRNARKMRALAVYGLYDEYTIGKRMMTHLEKNLAKIENSQT